MTMCLAAGDQGHVKSEVREPLNYTHLSGNKGLVFLKDVLMLGDAQTFSPTCTSVPRIPLTEARWPTSCYVQPPLTSEWMQVQPISTH